MQREHPNSGSLTLKLLINIKCKGPAGWQWMGRRFRENGPQISQHAASRPLLLGAQSPPPSPAAGAGLSRGNSELTVSPVVSGTRETGTCCPLQQQRQGGCMWIGHNRPESNHRTVRASLWPELRALWAVGEGGLGRRQGVGPC